MNKNVIKMFAKHNNNTASPDEKGRVKFYAGFNYVKLTKDSNGNKFNKTNLLSYAQNCHYMVTVMREINSEVVLYSYEVPNSDLFKFIKSFEENTLDGTIIEIEKYFADGLA